MSKQLHKNFINGQVKSLLKTYLDKEIKITTCSNNSNVHNFRHILLQNRSDLAFLSVGLKQYYILRNLFQGYFLGDQG